MSTLTADLIHFLNTRFRIVCRGPNPLPDYLRDLLALSEFVEIVDRLPGPNDRFAGTVSHRRRRPASAEGLATIRQELGEYAETVVAIYSLTNGFSLYCDDGGDGVAVKLFAVEHWHRLTTKCRKEFRSVLADRGEAHDPCGILTGPVFGFVPHTDHYFVLATRGNFAGHIFLVDFPGYYDVPFARDFTEFIYRLIRTDIGQLASDLGGYFRLTDGEGCFQWMPFETTELGRQGE